MNLIKTFVSVGRCRMSYHVVLSPHLNSRMLTNLIYIDGRKMPKGSGVQTMRQLWSGSRSANWCQKKEESDHVTGSSLIYMGPIRKAIHVTKFMSLTSSAVGLALQPTLISQATTVHPVVAVAIGSFVGFFTYVTPFLIHWMTKRYVVEMYFDAQNQTFECYTLTFFLRHKRLQFQASDVVIPDIPGPFTSIMVRDTPLLIDPKHFTDVEAYKLLMGYDKPLDLKLSNRDNESG